MRPLGILFSTLVSAVASSGCLLTTDLDRFESGPSEESDSLDCDNPRNVCLRLSDFSSRSDQLMQADLITDGFVHTRAMFDPVEADGDVEVILPLAIVQSELEANADFEVQLSAYNAKGDGTFEDTADETWRAALPADGNLEINNDDTPETITPPDELAGNFEMTLSKMTPHAGQLIEFWIQEEVSGRTAGYYRLAQGSDNGSILIRIPGIIGEEGSQYRIQFYADFDGSGDYQKRAGKPTGDHSWVRTAVANEDGLSLNFEHTGVFEDLDIPEGYGF